MAKSISTKAEIEKSIKTKDFYPIYILTGEEAFYIDKYSNAIIDNAIAEEERDFNLTIFYGNETTMTDVILASRRYPVMAERQVVVVREAQHLTKDSKNLELLELYAQNVVPSTILVICHKDGTIKSTELSKIFSKTQVNNKPCGVIFESKEIRDYNIGTDINEYVASIGCTIEPKAVSMLIDNVGNNMSKLAIEIDKLKLILTKGTRITPAIVEENIGISKEYNNFELLNAIADRDEAKALKIVYYFIKNSSKHPAVITSATLFNYFANLLLAHYARTSDETKLMETLRLKNSYGLKSYRIGMANYNASKCLKIINALREFDTKSKGIGSVQDTDALLINLITKILNY